MNAILIKELLKKHFSRYETFGVKDVFKFCHQSVFGCEHIVENLEKCVQGIKNEFEQNQSRCLIENLAGAYTRVHLGYLAKGLSSETLGKLLYLSAKKEKGSVRDLEKMLSDIRELISCKEIALPRQEFDNELVLWREQGYPALHHSISFRETYHPAYRVIYADYAPFITFLCNLDKMLKEKDVVLAIEGGSASGKSTLAALLEEIYSCTVFHVDDFFLQPHQRTKERLQEVGGNFDRERFVSQVITPLMEKGEVDYVRFDCATQALMPAEKKRKTHLTVIEGAYSMHPELEKAYDYSVFLSVSEKTQRERIKKRNTPAFAHRFFNEWIPKEKQYFEQMHVKERCKEIIEID